MTPDDIRVRNVNTVNAFYQAERDRDIDAWQKFWHTDGRHVFPFNADRTVSGVDELVSVTARKFEVRPPYEIHTDVEGFSDPTRVFARLRLVFDTEAVSGTMHLWCIFHFDDEGRVRLVEEMLDTATGLPIPR